MSDKVLNIFKLLENNKGRYCFVETKDGEINIFEDFSYNCYSGTFHFLDFEGAEVFSATALEDVKYIYSSKTVKTETSERELVKDKLLLEL